jgi:hypothetical protein
MPDCVANGACDMLARDVYLWLCSNKPGDVQVAPGVALAKQGFLKLLHE